MDSRFLTRSRPTRYLLIFARFFKAQPPLQAFIEISSSERERTYNKNLTKSMADAGEKSYNVTFILSIYLTWFSTGFFKGTSADQDRRFSDKELKLLKTMKFPPEFEKKVFLRLSHT